ncbi:MAG: caspase family protein [Ramlibacter sp.]
MVVTVAIFIATPVTHASNVALLIGNAHYASGLSPLTYPLQDIAALDQSLRRIGFDVTQVRNADQKTMRRAIGEFAIKARDAQVALVYYSGHGMQARDENFLLPVGAAIQTEADLDIEAYPLRGLMLKLQEASPRTAIVILDACRDNPVAGRTKSGVKGLARVANPPINTLIVYAAQMGATAVDNGVFAKELARHIVLPNAGIRSVFDKVGQAVRVSTGQRQNMQRDDQLTEDVVLVPVVHVPVVPASVFQAPTEVPQPPVPQARIEAATSPPVGAIEKGRHVDKNGCLREGNGSFVVGFRSDCR